MMTWQGEMQNSSGLVAHLPDVGLVKGTCHLESQE